MIPILGLISPLGAKAQASTTTITSDPGEVILFVREGCQYCSLTETFIEEQGLADKLIIKDVNADPANAAEYNKYAEEAGIPVDQRGVPMLYDNGEVVESADNILNRLGEKFGVSTEGYFPDADVSGEGEISSTVLIAIFGVAVIMIAGFIYISNKKDKR
ncbi:MAG: glutaredoxin domain-containing protein [Candidatus Dojkabacteria bacterium]|nr:glutaredoxin domain-containing protein [Candidatus Dojkabacteria bacterium]